MDWNTLTLYTVAAGLSACLCGVMLVFAHFQAGTHAIRTWAIGILVLSAGFFVSGIGPALPRWMTVIGTNLALIAGIVILNAGVSAYCSQREGITAWWGWAVLSAAAPAFWYWGIVEPNGHYRSVVFSLAVAAVCIPSTVLLVRAARLRMGGKPTWGMALLFGTVTLWMLGRATLLLVAPNPQPPDLRGANPTTWVTVFWYIVLMSLTVIGMMWMEANRIRMRQLEHTRPVFGFVEYFRKKLLLLWGAVSVLVLGVFGEMGIAYPAFYQMERARLVSAAEHENDSFVEYTLRLVSQVDTILLAVRGFHGQTHSLQDTQTFVQSLSFDKVIDSIDLVDAAGRIILSGGSAAVGEWVDDHDAFRFHRSTPGDPLFISPVDQGRISGGPQVRFSRRLTHADGAFNGLVWATIATGAFARNYQTLGVETGKFAALLSTQDRKPRVLVPEPSADPWQVPLESPLWQALGQAASGIYEHLSPFDHISRIFVYRKVGDLPLVMVTGFTVDEVTEVVHARMRWLAGTALAILVFTLGLAFLFTLEARRRNDQDRFMSMLSHELRTPLSLIRMSLGIARMPAAIKIQVERAVGDMNAIIERCLLSDRLLHQRVILALATCQIEEILNEARSASVAPERLRMRMKSLPPCLTDVQLLRVILANLIDNAFKYGAPEGEVDLRASVVPWKRRPGIGIEVINPPGPFGMPDPRRVFEKYYRGPGSHGKTGSGLGLHIAAGLAKKLHGRLSYRPTTEEVRFELWIPL